MTVEEQLKVLTHDECLGLLRSREMGRIAFDSDGKIQIFPINYGTQGSIIVFRTGPGTKLDVVPTTSVAFEVDSWDPESGVGWSVVAMAVTYAIGRPVGCPCIPRHPASGGTGSGSSHRK